MIREVITRNGKQFALVELKELHRLERLAARAASPPAEQAEVVQLPPADAAGNRPAVAFARASLARSIQQERLAVGWTQQELARRAGVRQETISRLESGKHSPTARTVEKIDRVLQAALKRTQRRTAATKR